VLDVAMVDNKSELPDGTLLFSYAANAKLDIDTWGFVDNQNVWLDRRAALYRYAPMVCEAFDADRERLQALLREPVLHADHDMDQVMRELADAAIGLLDGRWNRSQLLEFCRKRRP
jgi:hypothetical protein